jgi:hypothetical protein
MHRSGTPRAAREEREETYVEAPTERCDGMCDVALSPERGSLWGNRGKTPGKCCFAAIPKRGVS